MKKLILITSLFCLLLSGCSVQLAQEDTIPTENPEIGTSEPPESPTNPQEGFYLEDFYLWNGQERLTDQPIGDLLDGKEHYGYSIWNILEEQNETKIFLEWGGDCGGCVYLNPNYLTINNSNNSISTDQFLDANLSFLFERGVSSYWSTLAPNKSKVAFARAGERAEGELEGESIWIFDLQSGQEEQVALINEGETVEDCEDMLICSLDKSAVYWKGEDLIINAPHSIPISSNTMKHSFLRQAYYTFPIPYSENKGEPIPFDFNGDGMNEYTVYYEQELPETAQFNASEVTHNSAFKVFQWLNQEWTAIYEDEGTVGKEGYGVFSEFREDSFFEVVDVDNDAVEEVKITSQLEGSGAHSKSYILKWNGSALTKVEIVEIMARDEVEKEFLQEGERLAGDDLLFFKICPDDVLSKCATHSSASDVIGRLNKKFAYQNGKFEVIGYEREKH